MQFIYHTDAGASTLGLDKNEYTHLFKVRRIKEGSILFFRNMTDSMIYTYKLISLGRREAVLELLGGEHKEVRSSFDLTVGWAIIDPKVVEKTLPMLNEMGVEKIVFVYTDFSQKHFKPDIERLERIAINSSQQCGRSSLISFEIYASLTEYLHAYPNTWVVDFSENMLKNENDLPSSILIGCEGGFSHDEREVLVSKQIIGFKTPLILRSESAVVAVAAKILL